MCTTSAHSSSVELQEMRYLSVSSSGAFSVSVGASGELHGFTVQLLESSRHRLRVRSVTLGMATVVILRVGEIDEMLHRMSESRRGSGNGGAMPTCFPSPFSPSQHAAVYRYPLQDPGDVSDPAMAEAEEVQNRLFVVVGSDDGYSEATLLRIAALVSELCLFLNIDPLCGGPNAPVLKQVLLYLEERLKKHDVSLLCQTVERLLRPAIIATGFTNSGDTRGLLDELARQSFKHVSDDCQVPNYIEVLLGHKLVLETTPQWNEAAARMNGVERLTLHDSDRYLAYLVTCAFFSAPMLRSCYEASPRERRLRTLEKRLGRFGIHRHNVTRKAAQQAVQTYAAALQQEMVGECRRAQYYKDAYEDLLALVTLQDRVPGSSRSSAAGKSSRVFRNHYHQEDMDFDLIEGKTFQLNNICFRNSDFMGAMQLRWISAPEQQSYRECQHSDEGVDEEDPVMGVCPLGYGVCLLYLPPRSSRKPDRLRFPFSEAEDQVLRRFSQDLIGSMETSFNCFQWLLSPPVESYEIPGLIHFVAIDRRTNNGIVASFHRMMHQKPMNVEHAVTSLRRLVALNISRSHTLLHAGYSEGLWGHLGMQFFYCICALADSATAVPVSPSKNRGSPSTGAAISDESTPASGALDSLFGSLDARRKLPPPVVPHLVLRPMLLPDFTCTEPEDLRVVEVYAVFVGTMSPAEVCREVEKLLRSRVLPSHGFF